MTVSHPTVSLEVNSVSVCSASLRLAIRKVIVYIKPNPGKLILQT